jgi:NAD(P)-dependent dehydrogenase (short-subunit alcohol dehydrogenase family)
MRLKGKIAIVTGAASGIGRAACERFTAEGATVIAVDLDPDALAEVAESTGAVPITGSVGDVQTWEEAVAAARQQGGLHVAYLNAGLYGWNGSIDELPLDLYENTIAANITGVVLGVRASVPAMRESGGGAIVVTASAAAIVAFEGNPIYTLTKQAVGGFVRSVAPQLANDNITIDAVCPEVVDTPMTVEALGGNDPSALPIQLISPTTIADVAIDLATSPGTARCRAVRQRGTTVDWAFPTWSDLARA